VHVTLDGVVAIGSLVGLLIIIAGVLGAAFRTSRNVQSISNYRDAAQSWEARAGAQEAELSQQAHQIEQLQAQVTRLREHLAEKDRQIVTLQEQTRSLRELIAGRAVFEALETKMAELLVLGGENRAGIRQLLKYQNSPGGGHG
jgi:uncharacterized protein HemX